MRGIGTDPKTLEQVYHIITDSDTPACRVMPMIRLSKGEKNQRESLCVSEALEDVP